MIGVNWYTPYPMKYCRLDHDSHADHAVFQRRATKPTILWTTHREGKGKHSAAHEEGQGNSCGRQGEFQDLADPSLPSSHNGANSHIAAIAASVACATNQASEHPTSARKRSGMSLSEYLSKKAQIEQKK